MDQLYGAGTNPARAGSSLADLGFHPAQSLSPASFKDPGNAGECLISPPRCLPSTRPPLNPTGPREPLPPSHSHPDPLLSFTRPNLTRHAPTPPPSPNQRHQPHLSLKPTPQPD